MSESQRAARKPICIGTRSSPLARWQAEWVANQLKGYGHTVELVSIATQGDVDRRLAISEIGGLGLFTKELQRALLDGRIDVAVHSLKDLPTDVVPGLSIAATPPRESPFDALVARDVQSLDELPAGARIGTGSLRRQSQLLHARPDLVMAPIRGNVDTRLRKLVEGEFDAIVLAEAGLNRLSLSQHITQILAPPQFLPAVGQGVLGLETRDDSPIRETLTQLNHAPSLAAATAERSFLAALAGGCLAPIGGWAREIESGQLQIDGVVLSRDGTVRLADHETGAISAARELGACLARKLLNRGAGDLIQAARA